MDFHVCLDAPGEPASTLQIAKLGSFHDPRYGDFGITEGDVAKWKTNLACLPGGKALIDLDHLSDKPSPHRRTEAAGWITDIDLVDGVPQASVEWTPVGKSAIEEKRYQFFSPSFGEFRNDTGLHEDVLTGGALTNKPFLNMATVQLASDDRVSRALLWNLDEESVKKVLEMVAGNVTRPRADSRPAMLTSDILKTLGIEDEDAQKKILDLASAETPDEKKVLEAIEAAKPEPKKEDEPPTKTLEQQASEEGKTVLETKRLNKLELDAAAGREAMDTLNTERFETGFQLACDEGRAVAAEKETQAHFYSLDADATLKALKERQPMVNVKPIGRNVSTDDLDAPDGVQPQAFQLDQEVKAHMVEKDMKPEEYVTALHQVEAKRLAA